MTLIEKRTEKDILAEATVKLRIGEQIMHTVAEGDGPVNALDRAMRKALLPVYPELEPVLLTDYKVRIIDPKSATAALTRVLIDASDGERSWTTVGCSVKYHRGQHASPDRQPGTAATQADLRLGSRRPGQGAREVGRSAIRIWVPPTGGIVLYPQSGDC